MALIRSGIEGFSRRQDLSESEWMRLAVERGEAILVDGSEEKRKARGGHGAGGDLRTVKPDVPAWAGETLAPTSQADRAELEAVAAGRGNFVKRLIREEIATTKRRYRRKT
jgi:hypothetical protein